MIPYYRIRFLFAADGGDGGDGGGSGDGGSGDGGGGSEGGGTGAGGDGANGNDNGGPDGGGGGHSSTDPGSTSSDYGYGSDSGGQFTEWTTQTPSDPGAFVPAGPGWQSGAALLTAIERGNDGYLEFQIPNAAKVLAGGISNSDRDQSVSTMNYAICINEVSSGSFVVQVWEMGAIVFTHSVPPANNDVYRVAIVANVIRYYRNGINFYSSIRQPIYPLFADISFYSDGASVVNVNYVPAV